MLLNYKADEFFHRTDGWLESDFFSLSFYYSLLLVCCRYRALLVCLFFYSVDIPDGEIQNS